ncbi:MAG: NADH-quinone oxidoreductase subunit NuoG, partial [Dehalococcoidia bacterium]|nr:NADH-quinone oxidoreductase subunit NuoG [Dehalococcoidia bacterium]
QACLSLGLNLPYFCWHPAMHSVGACRQCAVRVFRNEEDTKGRIAMACMTLAAEGTRISISDPEANEFRRYVIEWLMANHPHDCPVCDEGGECHLQDMTVMCGQVYRRFRGRKRTHNNQYLGPFVNHEMNRCIQCWRCVRFYRDMAGGRDFGVFGSRNRVYFGRQKDGVLESEFAGNLAEVCPTGVFTDKTLKRHYTRKWDMETAPSVCIHCGLGCNTIPGARYGTLRRIMAKYNQDVNGYFLCDRGRFGYEFVNGENRIREGRIGLKPPNPPCQGGDAIACARDMLKDAKRVIGIGSPRASLEANYALKKLVGEESFSTGLSAHDQACAELALKILREGRIRTPSLAEVQSADAILILGADPTNEAPMLDFSIRQAVKRARIDISRNLRIPDWDANAVAEALQGASGKLYIASPWQVKLGEVAEESLALSFADTASLAERVAARIRTGDTPGDDVETRAASSLLQAKQPLIVTSIAAGTELLTAAADIAFAMRDAGKDPWLTIITPEANTFGAAMLGGMSVDEALSLLDSGEADALVVMENDLSRRVSPETLANLASTGKPMVVIDCIESQTSVMADVVIPSASWVESDGTFVSSEGRAQRFYQVFVPEGDLQPSWQVLGQLGNGEQWADYGSVLQEMAEKSPGLAGALEAGLPADWRSPIGRKVARMSHRFSGRTAKDADKTMNEPLPPDDPGTPFAFSMEGEQNPVPGPLTPRFWSPEWNSVNSVTKFQTQINGPLTGGKSGKRLIEPSTTTPSPLARGEGRGEGPSDGALWLIPRPYIFGSEELSRLSPGIAELSPKAELSIHSETAQKLGLKDGDTAEITADGIALRMIVSIDDGLAQNVATVPAGIDET